jgi:hypothetical protein
LGLLGAELGERLLPPREDNKSGFWEHEEAVEIHERVLASLGRTWHDMRELPAGWEASDAATQAINDIASLIERDFSGVRLWAVKDPRMCRLAPLWLRALEKLGIRATVLVMARDPQEVAGSLKTRDGWSHGHAYLLWARHIAEAVHSSIGVPRSILTYEGLLSDWRGNLARIRSQLGMDWQLDEAAEQAIDEFVKPSEQHHGVNKSTDPREVPALVSQLYTACESVVANGHWSTLEVLSNTFFQMSVLFDHPLDEVIRARDEFGGLSHERMVRIHELDDENARISAERARISNERSEFEFLAIERIDRIKQLEAEYFDKVQWYSQLAGRLATASESVSSLEAARVSLIEGQAEARALAEDRLARLGEAEARLAAQAQELATLRICVQSRMWLLKRLFNRLGPT